MRYFCVFSAGRRWVGSQEPERGEPATGEGWMFKECFEVIQLVGQNNFGSPVIQFLPVAPVWAKNAERPRFRVEAWYELDAEEYGSALQSVRASKAGLTVAR